MKKNHYTYKSIILLKKAFENIEKEKILIKKNWQILTFSYVQCKQKVSCSGKGLILYISFVSTSTANLFSQVRYLVI